MKTLKHIFKNKTVPTIALVVVLLGLDQVSKLLVKTNMTLYQDIPIFGDWFHLVFIENPGAAYGMQLGGDYGKLMLSIFRIAAVIFLIWYIHRLIVRDRKAIVGLNEEPRVKTGMIVGLTIILAGALGNIFDSVFYGMIFSESTAAAAAHWTAWGEGYGTFLHGAVVDMLHFPLVEIEQMPDWVPIWGGGEFIFFAPVFNIADSYVTCGMAYLVIFHFKSFLADEPKRPKSE